MRNSKLYLLSGLILTALIVYLTVSNANQNGLPRSVNKKEQLFCQLSETSLQSSDRCPYLHLDTIRYTFTSDIDARIPIVDILSTAYPLISEMGAVIQRPILFDAHHAEIEIDFKNIDGLGTILGQAKFPPCDEKEKGKVILDALDMRTLIHRASLTFAHEIGHALGIGHSPEISIMGAAYDANIPLILDQWTTEKLRELYKVSPPESAQKKNRNYSYVRIDNSPELITRNFKNYEFFGADDPDEIEIPIPLIIACQLIRDAAKSPVSINDVWRKKADSKNKDSRHISGHAIDLSIQSTEGHEKIKQDFATEGPLFQELMLLGINGFGLYNRHLHIDIRTKNMNKTYKGTTFSRWYGYSSFSEALDWQQSCVHEHDL